MHEHCHRKYARLQGKYDTAADDLSKLQCVSPFQVNIC